MILITGGDGFLGQRLVVKLRESNQSVFVVKHSEYDLCNLSDVHDLFLEHQPDTVIHLAAHVGGIGLNDAKPAELFYHNLMMGAQVLHEAWRTHVKKFVAVGTICCYPKFAPTPFIEQNLWEGYPEETNAPYGMAKKILLVQSHAYRKQYGFNSIFLMPTNLYGPGDNFDESSSHVIPALIRKCIEAKERGDDQIIVWGSGNVTREFLYVDDAADAIVLATEKYNESAPVNLGSGIEISIRTLAEMIRALTDFKGHLIFDSNKPDGQPHRCLNTSRAEHEFGFKAHTSFSDGLERTVKWYGEHRIIENLSRP